MPQQKKQLVDGKLLCTACGQWLIAGEFGIDVRQSTGRQSWCLRCSTVRKYGMKSRLEYDALLAEQGGVCAICKQPPESRALGMKGTVVATLVVDHDHETGKVRGLLCLHCNAAIGYFKDNIAFLNEAIRYVQAGGFGGQKGQ